MSRTGRGDAPEMRRFGEKLHALRQRNGMTLKELAHALGLGSHSYLSELESSKKVPTAEFVLGVSRLFDVPTDALLKDENELPSPENAASTATSNKDRTTP